MIANSIKTFNERVKERVEKQFINLFEQFKKEGIVSQDSINTGVATGYKGKDLSR